jgi:predicted aspartyl protease
MTFPFNPAQGLIIVAAEVVGPTTSQVVRLALDTGSNGTIVDPDTLTDIGYDLTRAPRQAQATTASRVVRVARLPVRALSALGRTVPNLLVAAHRVPNTAIDGVLGLDFLRGNVLTIDFIKGEITLIPGGPTP